MADAFEEEGDQTVSINEYLEDLEEQELVISLCKILIFCILIPFNLLYCNRFIYMLYL